MILPIKRTTIFKGADQAAQMRRLVCAFVVGKQSKTGVLASRHIYVNNKTNKFYFRKSEKKNVGKTKIS